MDRPSARLLPRAEAALRDGDHALAERVLKRVLLAEPMNSKANEMLGYIAGSRGDMEEAGKRLEMATRSPEASRDAWYLLGIHRNREGNPGRAVEALSRAVAMDASFFEAVHDLGVSLTELGETEAAVAQLDRATVLRPRSLEAWYNRGRALEQARRFEEAVQSYDRALEWNPGHAASWTSRAAALLDLDRSEEAVTSFERALEIAPDHVAALSGRGVALYDLQRDDEALASFARALKIRPGDPEIEWRAAFAYLAKGDLETGFELHERRWSRTAAPPRAHAEVAPWRGEDLRGKRVLAWSEQGYGDTLQFCRYVEFLSRDASQVVVQVPAGLRGLLARSFPECAVVSWDENPGACDVQIPLMSLPHAYRTRLDTIPSGVPYLRADAARVQGWREKLAGVPEPKVGIACSGNAELRRDRTRSIPLREFSTLASHARLFLLQADVRPDDAAWLRENPGRVTVFDALADFDETAAIVACMDAIVTVDTALAHLAGALARPTRILLAPDSDWRWLRERADSPWYPSARLFRRESGESWPSVVTRAAASLGALRP